MLVMMASRTRFLGLLSWVKSIRFQSYVSSLSEYSQIPGRYYWPALQLYSQNNVEALLR